jgi:uncharacterized protein (DUF1800 family)
MGVEAWLEEQLRPEQIDDPIESRVAQRYPSVEMGLDELFSTYPPPQQLQALRVRLQDSTSLRDEERRRLRRELTEKAPGRVLGEMTAAKLTRAAFSERQLEQVMTDFWFDHFNVFWGKGASRWLVADYERSAIRPHVFGSFEDMLVATASHPAMLFYLDNWRSMAPDTAAIRERVTRAQQEMSRRSRSGSAPRPQRTRGRDGRGGIGVTFPIRPNGNPQRGRPFGGRGSMDQSALNERLARLPGLNENYARELLELHTLGVDGGYTQDDVVDVARAFTGWTLQMPRNGRGARDRQGGGAGREQRDGDYGFVYRSEVHDKGEKTILGRRFQGGGQDEGRQVLEMLATHPSTARHIATQMVTRFVADDPPEALVEHLTQVFLDTGGDLREVTRSLFTAHEFYAPEHMGSRIKSPVILAASALRATGAEILNPRSLIETLRSLEQAPYLAEAPTGYDEASGGWVSGGAMLNRMNFSTALASGSLRGVRPDGASLLAAAGAVGPTALDGLAAVMLPGTDTTELLAVIREDLERDPPGSDRQAAMRALGLILGSPEFQTH